MFAVDSLGDTVQFRLRLFDAHPWTEPGDDLHAVIAARLQLLRRHLTIERGPSLHLAIGKLEPRRHDSDHGIVLAIESDELPDNTSASAEMPLPQAVADDEHASRGRRIFFRQKRATQGGLDAERREQVVRANDAANPFGKPAVIPG